jgi:hypothetical protein
MQWDGGNWKTGCSQPVIGTCTELFQLVGDNCMNFSHSILLKGKMRRSKGFKKMDLSLIANGKVLSSNRIKGEKNYHLDLMFPVFKV